MGRSKQFLAAMDAYNADRPELALGLMEECARQGDPVACYMTALWYRKGEGTRPDVDRSAVWSARLEELAQLGDLEAQWEVGQHYRFGDLLPLNITRANHWLERAAEGGYGEAQHHLAWYFQTGQYGYPLDLEAAETWYSRAFEQGHPETLYLFAIRRFHDGQPTDEALRLLRESAEKGFKQAAEILRSYSH